MEDEEKFCSNCKRNVAAVNFVIHIAFCERKIQLCQLCGEPVQRSELDDHLKEYHILENCTFCKVPIEKWKLDSHQKDQCRKRNVNCKYCDLSQALDSISEHEESCGSRTDECSSCNNRFLLKEKEAHLKICQKNNAMKTQMLCSYCESSFPAENYYQHVKSCVYRSEKCLKCGDLVRLKDLKEHGDICCQENRRSSYFCEYCDQKFSWKEFQSHQSYCRARFKICRQCHESVKVSDLEHHLEVCQKIKRRESIPLCKHCGKKFPSSILEIHESSCACRCEKCRYCQDFVKYKDMESHKEVCEQVKRNESELSCEHCGKKFPSNILENHRSNCEFRCEKCTFCYEYVKYKDLEYHRKVCGQVRNYNSKVAFEHCNSQIPVDLLKEQSICDFQKCPLCDVAVKVKDMDSHRRSCEHMEKSSKAACEHCSIRIPINMLEAHEFNCDFRCEICLFCNVAVKVKDMDNHRNLCEQMKKHSKTTCEHCSSEIPINMLEDHESNCDFHCKNCPLCNVAVKVKDMDNHRRICEQRKKCQSKVACEHCEMEIPFKNLDEHQLNCGFRLEKCSLCYDIMQVNEMDSHRIICEKIHLSQLPTSCQFCQLEFPSEELDYHIISCGANVEKCFRCDRMIKLRNFKDHKEDCLKNDYEKQEEGLTKTDQVEQALEIESDERPVPCEYCYETFPLSCLMDHMNTCQDIVEKCLSCNASVKFKDKQSHKEHCMVPTEEKCAICSLSFPKDKLSEHFNKCVEDNSNHPYSECGMSMPLPIASHTDNSKVRMHSESSKTNLYPSLGNLLLCPYCSTNFPQKRFNSHKKYCKKALIECPICADTYHIEETDEHKKTCDALDNVLSQESDFSMELHNKFETLQSEENMREKEALNEKCPYCEKKIPRHAYAKHLSTCSQSMKQCHLCQKEYPKDCDKEHLDVCPIFSLNKDEFVYPGFSKDRSKMEDYPENTSKCKGCKKYIPRGAMDSHLSFCNSLNKCLYCKEFQHGNVQTHLTKCGAYKETQQKSLLKKDTGTKPKKKNSQETGNAFHKIIGSVKNYFSAPEKANSVHFIDSTTNLYAGSANCDKNFAVPSAPPEENQYVSCEFCGEDILMDPEAIVMHESGCRPDLISLPPRASDQHKLHISAHEAYSDIDQASAFQSESRFLQKSENKNVTPDDVSDKAKHIRVESYDFMKNFRNKYDTQKDISYQEDLEEKATKGNLGSEINDVKHYPSKYRIEDVNTWDYKEDSRSKYLEEKYESKITTTSNDEYPENVLKSPENEEIKENADVYQARSYLRRSKISTEPGEFLKNNLESKQFDLISSQKNEKFSSDSAFEDHSDSNVQNSNKLHERRQEMDAVTCQQNVFNRRDNPIQNNRRKVQSTEEQMKSEWVANKSSRNNNEDIGVIGMKIHSSKELDKNAPSYADHHRYDSDPESSNESHSDYGNKHPIHSDWKNGISCESSGEHISKGYSNKDYKKDINALSKVMNENIFACDPEYDSDPESCEKMKDSNVYDYKFTKSKTGGFYSESGKQPNQDLFKTEDSSFFHSSKMQGPVKIERISLKKTDSKINKDYAIMKQLAASNAKEIPNPDLSSFKSTDAFDKSSKERMHRMYFKEMQQTAKTDIYPDTLKNSSYNQCSETNAKNQVPMEIDNENNVVEKHTSGATDYFSHLKKYPEFSDLETKDSNMDSYFEFLRNDKDELPESIMCKKCGNEMCFCKIEKSLSTARRYSFSDEFDDKGTYPCNSEEIRNMNERMKSYQQTNDYRYLKAKSSVGDKKANYQPDQWKKYRSPSDDSD